MTILYQSPMFIALTCVELMSSRVLSETFVTYPRKATRYHLGTILYDISFSAVYVLVVL